MQNSKCSYRGSFPIGLALQLVLLCKNGIEMVLDHLNCYISEVCSIVNVKRSRRLRLQKWHLFRQSVPAKWQWLSVLPELGRISAFCTFQEKYGIMSTWKIRKISRQATRKWWPFPGRNMRNCWVIRNVSGHRLQPKERHLKPTFRKPGLATPSRP